MDLTKNYIKMVDWPEIQDRKPDFDAEGEDQNFVANYHFARACPTHGKDHLWTKDLSYDHFCCTCGQPLIPVDFIPNIDPYEENDAYKTIWLPRQDQLQEMLDEWVSADGGTSIESIYLACNFAKFCGIYDQDAEGSSNISIRKGSMEQLWLAFVMHKLYQKRWDGSTWIANNA